MYHSQSYFTAIVGGETIKDGGKSVEIVMDFVFFDYGYR